MINKTYTKTGKKCRVTFKLPAEAVGEATAVDVLGDFNGWSPGATPLTRRKGGAFSTTASLEAGREYHFRYLIDGESWMTDEEADELARNRFGDLDSVVVTRVSG